MEPRNLFANLIAEVRDTYRNVLDETERWTRIGQTLEAFVSREEVREASRRWSVPLDGGPYNLLFYEDGQFGFVIHGLLKQPGVSTPVHDHGSTWTAYGLLQGNERIVVVNRSLEGNRGYNVISDRMVSPGHVDVVEPNQLHAEYSGETPTVAVIIRSGRVDNALQTILDLDSGMTKSVYGPKQLAGDIERGRV